MSDIADARSAYLEAKAEFEEWKDQFLYEWYMPDILAITASMINNVPSELKPILESAYPGITDTVFKTLKTTIGGK